MRWFRKTAHEKQSRAPDWGDGDLHYSSVSISQTAERAYRCDRGRETLNHWWKHHRLRRADSGVSAE